jgi:uncharacterized metal-binding protein
MLTTIGVVVSCQRSYLKQHFFLSITINKAMYAWINLALLCFVVCASVTALALSIFTMVKYTAHANQLVAARVAVDTTAFTAFDGTTLDGITLTSADRVVVTAVIEPVGKVSDYIGVYQFAGGALKRCTVAKGTLVVITAGTQQGAWYHVLTDHDIENLSSARQPVDKW